MGKVIAFNKTCFDKARESYLRSLNEDVGMLFVYQRSLASLRNKKFVLFRKTREKQINDAISLLKKDIISNTRMYCSIENK